MRTIAAVLLLTLGLNACFAYQTPGGDPLAQGQGVKVHLSSPMDVRLAEVTANNVAAIEGEVVRADDRELVVSATLIRSTSGYEQLGQGATVVIPRERIGSLEERRVSTLRSAGLVGLIVGLSVALTAVNTGTGVKGGPGGGPGSGQ